MEGERALKLAEDVVRMVVRAFYDHEAVIVLDGLLYLSKNNSVRDQVVLRRKGVSTPAPAPFTASDQTACARRTWPLSSRSSIGSCAECSGSWSATAS